MGWEDTWIPEARRLFRGEGPVKEHPPDRLLADRLTQETPNHRRLRLSVAYGRLADDAARQAVDALRNELTGRGLQYDEWGSTTYSPFYCQGVGLLTALAAERNGPQDRELLRWCKRWWAAWTGLAAAVSVPIPHGGGGKPQVPGSGMPQRDLLQHGEVLGPGFRCNRDRNRDNGILLRLLCGLETRWDRRVIDRVHGDLDSHRSMNLLQLAYVDRLLERGVLQPVEYDPPRLAEKVSKLKTTLHVERWKKGYRAWFDEAEGRGPVHFGILVHDQRVVYLDRDKRKQKKVWRRDAEVPPAPVAPEVRLTIPAPAGEVAAIRLGDG